MISFNFNLNKLLINYINHWNNFPNLFPNYTVISVNIYIQNHLNYVLNVLLIKKYLFLIYCFCYYYKHYGKKTY